MKLIVSNKGLYFIKDDNLDEELTLKIVKVIDHFPHRENKKYRYLEAKGNIHLVKDPHDVIAVTICLDYWNIEHARLWPTNPVPKYPV